MSNSNHLLCGWQGFIYNDYYFDHIQNSIKVLVVFIRQTLSMFPVYSWPWQSIALAFFKRLYILNCAWWSVTVSLSSTDRCWFLLSFVGFPVLCLCLDRVCEFASAIAWIWEEFLMRFLAYDGVYAEVMLRSCQGVQIWWLTINWVTVTLN